MFFTFGGIAFTKLSIVVDVPSFHLPDQGYIDIFNVILSILFSIQVSIFCLDKLDIFFGFEKNYSFLNFQFVSIGPFNLKMSKFRKRITVINNNILKVL